MSTKERKRKSAKERKRAQKGAKERKRAPPRRNCKRPGLKQPGLGTPNLSEEMRHTTFCFRCGGQKVCVGKLYALFLSPFKFWGRGS